MFKKGQSGNPKGRTPGSKNRLTGAHGDLIAAWDHVAGPRTAEDIVKVAVKCAKDGNFSPLSGLLPYIARRMPDTLELGPIETMTPEEIDALWSKKQDKPSGPSGK